MSSNPSGDALVHPRPPEAHEVPSPTEDHVPASISITAPSDVALPLLLTPEETATLLRTTRKAVYAMAERALLPGVTRLGRRLLIRRDDLLAWLDERRAASPGR
jgi:excisionase family DNA binding protein